MNKLMVCLMAGAAGVATLCTTACGDSSPTVAGQSSFSADTALTDKELQDRRFTPEVMWKMGRLGSSAVSADGKQVVYSTTYYDVAGNKAITSLWMMNLDGSGVRQLTDHSGNDSAPVWSTDGERVYFLSNRSGNSQVWSIETASGTMRQLSHCEGDVSGFGLSGDQSKVWLTMEVKVQKVSGEDFFPLLAKSEVRIYDDLMVRHWDVWEDGMYSHIFVGPFSVSGVGQLADINKGEPWDCPTAPNYDSGEISWNAAGDAVAYTARKLTGVEYSVSTNTDIYLFRLADTTTTNLTQGMVGYDKYPRFSPDGRWMAWQSMERAGNESDKDRLMVMELSTGDRREATAAFEHNASNLVWGGDSRSIYFISPIQATIQVCKVDLSADATGGDVVTVITEGEHDFLTLELAGSTTNAATPSSTTLVAQRCDLSHAPELFSLDVSAASTASSMPSPLATAVQITDIDANIYANMDMGKVTKRWVKTTDGQQMLVWVILPPGFDESKSYPTLLYCQGGPQQVVSQFWSYRWNFQLMAAQGYVVVAPNRRGLPSFGKQWLDQISGDYAGQCQRDYLSAIDDVAAEPWTDENRMGCVGASFGGFSVFYQAGHHNKRFKAFISHCGMFDLESFYGATEELWFPNNDLGGAYWDKGNAIAQRSYANSPHRFVNNWDTPILIITGEKDYRIPYTQSLEAFTAARSHGIPSRLVSFKDEGHIILKPQNSLVWNSEFFSWLDTYLK